VTLVRVFAGSRGPGIDVKLTCEKTRLVLAKFPKARRVINRMHLADQAISKRLIHTSLRRRMLATPTKPLPNMTSELGSGTELLD
jgi:hypothetical protein